MLILYRIHYSSEVGTSGLIELHQTFVEAGWFKSDRCCYLIR